MIQNTSILNGTEIAKKYLERIAKEVREIQQSGGRLALGTIQVGEAKDARMYAKAIEKLFNNLEIPYFPNVYAEKISEFDLLKAIAKLNADPGITGILVFAPLPKHLTLSTVLNAVDIQKDVEGRRVLHGFTDRVMPPTALACLALIEETACVLEGQQAVVIGRSDVVGKPAALLLVDKHATVTVCHSKTQNLRKHIEEADILIATAGKPNLVKGEWIKRGAVVIDVGENVVGGKLVGDVEFETAKERAGFITPVPGGVGPVTKAMLVQNLLKLYHRKAH